MVLKYPSLASHVIDGKPVENPTGECRDLGIGKKPGESSAQRAREAVEWDTKIHLLKFFGIIQRVYAIIPVLVVLLFAAAAAH